MTTIQNQSELTDEENGILLSAISLSSQEKEVAACLKEAKAEVLRLFQSRFDTTKTGTIAKFGKSTVQVKKKAGKKELTDEVVELQERIQLERGKLDLKNAVKHEELANKIIELQAEITALHTSEDLQFMIFDLEQRIASLPEPDPTYEVAIKV